MFGSAVLVLPGRPEECDHHLQGCSFRQSVGVCPNVLIFTVFYSRLASGSCFSHLLGWFPWANAIPINAFVLGDPFSPGCTVSEIYDQDNLKDILFNAYI